MTDKACDKLNGTCDEYPVCVCGRAWRLSQSTARPAAPAIAPLAEPRPHLRDDGIPTRADIRFWSDAERAIATAMRAVEDAGASLALTDAVILLGKARDRVADHVEGKP